MTGCNYSSITVSWPQNMGQLARSMQCRYLKSVSQSQTAANPTHSRDSIEVNCKMGAFHLLTFQMISSTGCRWPSKSACLRGELAKFVLACSASCNRDITLSCWLLWALCRVIGVTVNRLARLADVPCLASIASVTRALQRLMLLDAYIVSSTGQGYKEYSSRRNEHTCKSITSKLYTYVC